MSTAIWGGGVIDERDPYSTLRSLVPISTRPDASRLARLYWITFIVAFALLAHPLFASQHGLARTGATEHAGKLYDFKIAKPNFLVDGANLSKVEVWYWPTGTGIMKPALIGIATRITDPGKHEKWVLRIPPELLAVEVVATAFDEAGNAIGKKSLPYKGASALYKALYGKK